MSGHVFVVRGDITAIQCDAWLLPSDARGYLEPNWIRSATGGASRDVTDGRLDRERPDGWGDEGRRTLRIEDWWADDGPVTWLTNVGGGRDSSIDWFMDGVRQFLETASVDLRHRGAKARNRRSKHLLAIPVVGTRAGGGAERKGAILSALLTTAAECAGVNDVDVAIVTWNDEAFAAAQGVRRRRLADAGSVWPELSPEMIDLAAELGGRAVAGDLVLFLGAGTGAAAGLPLWQGLLDQLARDVGLNDGQVHQLQLLDMLDQARLLEARFVAEGRSLGHRVADLVSTRRYALTHALLANLPATEVVTVNYDELFERASEDAGHAPSVLPYDEVESGRRWVLKLHGSVGNPEDIVLTRSDYLRYADRRAALAGIVQALLITRHMLFIGFSLTDDNFNRIVEDVRRAVHRGEAPPGEPPLGTALLLHDIPMMLELWKDDLRCVPLAPSADQVDPAAARRLEVFLDCLLTHASSNASHLLDPTFDALLTPEERELRRLLRGMVEGASPELQGSPFWRPIAGLLERFGHPTESSRHR